MTRDRDEFDIELMRCLAEGDDLALNRLMDAWSQPLIAYLIRLTGSDATAQDLAQETFVRVYRHRLEYRSSQKFSTWLFAIATNLARNHARWRGRHPETLLGHENLSELPVIRRMLRPTSKPSPTSASPPCKKPSRNSRRTCARFSSSPPGTA
jgi:RNA polymerase sigma-70 factor (ECF subfamily)